MSNTDNINNLLIIAGRDNYPKIIIEAARKSGVKNIHVFCPGFSSDCLETIDEIGRESKEEFLEHGGDSFEFIPCLNSDENFVEALMNINSSKKIKIL